MQIQVNADDVNRVVADAILKSALGKGLETAVNKAMDETLNGYNSPVKTLVSQHVTSCIREVLDTTYREKIVALIAEKLSSEHVDAIVKASIDKAMKMLAEDSRY